MSTRLLSRSLGLLLSRGRGAVSRLWVWEARFKGVEFRGPVQFFGRPLISVAPGSWLVLGAGVTVNSAVRSNVLGCFQPSVLRTLEPGAELVLGDRAGLSGAVVCAGLSIRIGENTLLGSGAMVLDNDFHARTGELDWRNECRANAKPIVIGRGVFIGARAIVLKGVTIGDGAVVGAGAVVSKDVPPGAVAVGNPARVLEPRTAGGP